MQIRKENCNYKLKPEMVNQEFPKGEHLKTIKMSLITLIRSDEHANALPLFLSFTPSTPLLGSLNLHLVFFSFSERSSLLLMHNTSSFIIKTDVNFLVCFSFFVCIRVSVRLFNQHFYTDSCFLFFFFLTFFFFFFV